MDFLNFVQKGVAKSNKCLAAIAEVDNIFKNVNADLKRYTAGELKLVRSISGRAQIGSIVDMVAGVESSYLKSDRILLLLKTSNGEFSEDVAGWKQRATGYPCILKFDGQELSCGTSAHLVNGISELLASVGFGNAVNNLTKQALESGVQKKSSILEAGQPTRLSLVNKPVVKPTAAKATAKPADYKAAAKPVASTTAVKPAAAKVAAKPIAAKAAAKPVAAKAAAKPVAAKKAVKPAAAKVAAKPVAAKAAAKPLAAKAARKPRVAKAAVKPASVDASDAEPNAGKSSREYRKNEIGDVSK
jgi:hypothetical protein